MYGYVPLNYRVGDATGSYQFIISYIQNIIKISSYDILVSSYIFIHYIYLSTLLIFHTTLRNGLFFRKYKSRDRGRSVIEGTIFIYSDSASLISFEIDCFHGL